TVADPKWREHWLRDAPERERRAKGKLEQRMAPRFLSPEGQIFTEDELRKYLNKQYKDQQQAEWLKAKQIQADEYIKAQQKADAAWKQYQNDQSYDLFIANQEAQEAQDEAFRQAQQDAINAANPDARVFIRPPKKEPDLVLPEGELPPAELPGDLLPPLAEQPDKQPWELDIDERDQWKKQYKAEYPLTTDGELDFILMSPSMRKNYIDAVRNAGRTPETEDFVRGILPSATEQDFVEFFKKSPNEIIEPLYHKAFPGSSNSDYVAFINSWQSNPDKFVDTIRTGGRTKEKQDLLRAMDYTWDNINLLFSVQKLEVPVDGEMKLVNIDMVHNKVYNDNGTWMGTWSPATREFEKLPEEGVFKDAMDAVAVASFGLLHDLRQTTVDLLPKVLFRDASAIERKLFGDDYADKMTYQNRGARAEFSKIYGSNQVVYDDFIADHPEWAPKPKFEEGVMKHPDLAKDPAYWLFSAARAAPFMIAAMGAIATGGWLSGLGLVTGLMYQNTKNILLENGATPGEINVLALPLTIAIAGVETIGDMLILKNLAPGIFKGFQKTLQKELAKGVIKGLRARTVGGKIIGGLQNTANQVLQEDVQEIVTNAGVRFINENQGLFEGLAETTIESTIAFGPMTLAGSMLAGGKAMTRVPPSELGELSRNRMIELGWRQDDKNGNWYRPMTFGSQKGFIKIPGGKKGEGEAELPPKVAPRPVRPEGIPFMITRKMESDLKAKGFTQDAIDDMTPRQAWDNLQKEEVITPKAEPLLAEQFIGPRMKEKIAVLDARGAPDLEYMSLTRGLSGRQWDTPLKKGETWRGRAVEQSEKYIARYPVSPPPVATGVKPSPVEPPVAPSGVVEVKPASKATLTDQVRQMKSELEADVNITRKKIADIKTPIPTQGADVQFARWALNNADKLLKRVSTLTDRIERGQEVSQDEIDFLNDKIASLKDFYEFEAETKAGEYKTELERQKAEAKGKAAGIVATKKTLTNYLRKFLPVAQQGKLLTAVRDAKTDKDLFEVIKRADEIGEQAEQRRLKGEINTLIAKTKVKKVAGVPVGKFIPGAQDLLDIIRGNLKGDRLKAKEGIANNIQAYNDGKLSYDEMLNANELLGVTGLNEMTSDEMQTLKDDIESIILTGRTLRAEKDAAYNEKMDAVKADVQDVLTGGKGLKPGGTTVSSRELEAASSWADRFINWQYNWDNLMDKLSKFTKAAPYKSAISKFGNAVHRARNNEYAGVQKAQKEVRDAFYRIAGVKTKREANTLLNQWHDEVIDLGEFKNTDGETVRLRMTRGQMQKKYMEMQDTTLDRTFREGMKWTDKMVNAVGEAMTDTDIAWADWQMNYYQEYYKGVDEIYSDIYGTHLPHNEFYSPINRDLADDIDESILFYQDLSRYASVKNGSLKSRVGSIKPLKFSDANDTLINHITQMEHFKAWAHTIRDLRKVFGSSDIQTAIRQYHGKPILQLIEKYINGMARDGREKSFMGAQADWLRRNFTKSVLAIKPSVAMRQVPSVFAYTVEMGGKDFFGGVADFWKNPIKNYRELLEKSAYARQRFGSGFERDISFALKGKATQAISGKGNFTDVFMELIRMGDKLAVAQGMWAKYQQGLKQGLTKEEAMAGAEDLTNRTQPAFDYENLSVLQNSNPWLKLTNMFQNQPGQYFRIMASSLRNLQYGRGSKVKNISNLALVWIAMPTIFWWMAAGFKYREEEQLKKVLLAPLNYMLTFGQMVDSVAGWISGEPYDYQASPIFATAQDAKNGISKIRKMVAAGQDPYKDVSMDDFIAAVEFFAKAGGQIMGYPTPYLVQAERGLREGEPRELIFSRYALRETNKDDKSKATEMVEFLGKREIDVRLESKDVDVKKKAQEELADYNKRRKEGETIKPLPEYNLKDLNSDYNKIFDSILPQDIIDGRFNKEAKAWAQKEIASMEADSVPPVALYEINTDQDEGETIVQYYKQWKARQKITNLSQLKEFDKMNPNAKLGNVTRQQYDLLVKYMNAPDEKKPQFVKDHLELKVNPRDEWLKVNPIENAQLALWGQAQILSLEAYKEVKRLISTLDVTDGMLPDKTLPPDASVENYFNYLETGKEHGWNSWETQLAVAADDDLREFLGRELIDTPVESLELKVKNRATTELIESYSDKESPNYIEDEDKRREQTKATKLLNMDYVKDMARSDMLDKKITDTTVLDEYSAHQVIALQEGPMSVKAKLNRLDHPGMNAVAVSIGIWKDDLSDEVIEGLRIRDNWAEEFEAVKAIKTPAGKKAYYAEHMEFSDDRRRLQMYTEGADPKDTKLIEAFVERGHLIDEFSANSPEVKLYNYKHSGLQDFGDEEDTFNWKDIDVKKVPIWEIQAKWRPETEERAALLEKKDKVALKAWDKSHTEYRADMRRAQIYNLGADPKDKKLVEAFVERGKLVDVYGGGSATVKLFNSKHPELQDFGDEEDTFDW
ncbi:MAG: hypothetical protein Q8O55_08675, partial [Dehalococcoidales bacterium]|nr:hypothetical protein [Dehalococcoidales bacterium]